MAKQSAVEMACASLDARIAELQREIDGLQRSKEIIRDSQPIAPIEAPRPRKPRGPNKKRGLPAPTASNGE